MLGKKSNRIVAYMIQQSDFSSGKMPYRVSVSRYWFAVCGVGRFRSLAHALQDLGRSFRHNAQGHSLVHHLCSSA